MSAFGRLAVANRGDEVVEVAPAELVVRPFRSTHRLVVAVDDQQLAALAEHHAALGAEELDAGVAVVRIILRPEPHLEHELPRDRLAVAGKVPDAGGRVGKLLVVVEEILAADRGDLGRQRVDAEAPAGVVDFVGAVVADVAGAEVVPPVPIAVETIRLERDDLGRADPEVVVDAGRHRARLAVADVLAALDVPGLGHEHVADDAFAELLDGVRRELAAALLRAVLTTTTLCLRAAATSSWLSRKLWLQGFST